MKVLLTILIVLISCSTYKSQNPIIRISGSSTLYEASNALANEFMKRNPKVKVIINYKNTKSGFEELSAGKSEIAMASRYATPEEVSSIADEYNSIGMSHLIAKDALSIYTHPYNSIDNLSLEQLRKIYTCEIKNWKELGGSHESIIPLSRPTNSGTQMYFRRHVLKEKQYCRHVVIVQTTNEIANIIEKDTRYIGYGDINSAKNLDHIKINGVEPTKENIRNGTYPIVRYLYYYTSGKPKGHIKDFIDFVLSPEGQTIIDSSGFVSLW